MHPATDIRAGASCEMSGQLATPPGPPRKSSPDLGGQRRYFLHLKYRPLAELVDHELGGWRLGKGEKEA